MNAQRLCAVFRKLFGAAILTLCGGISLYAQTVNVTYPPYLQPGDNGPFGPADQIVIAWQTNETSPNPSNYHVDFGMSTAYGSSTKASGRVVDNYLAADPSLPTSPTNYGAHVNYVAVLSGLSYDATYLYRVTGPGMPANGFTASFHTRTKGSSFSFAVEGDEGFFPGVPNSSPATMVNYEARIAHLIYNAGTIPLQGSSSRPSPAFVLNTGDNIYTNGAEGSYRDFFFPVLNNDLDSNETGAPILRNMLYYIVGGNHDYGSTGVSVNLLADNSAPRFGGNTDGGDALAYFNDLYYPLNGPTGFDIQYTWDGESPQANGMYFSYQNKTYTSPSAIEAFRASTNVDGGQGDKRQIDHMSNYSFDYGNAHFLFLDANPHLFDGNLPSGSASTVPPPPAFTPYPSALRNWVVNDLDKSKQTWKVVVFHQPPFSSGDATILNNQMRAVAKVLEDHGVNVVFNGHDHNYQRSLPIRATSRAADIPSTIAGTPAVQVDQAYDGTTHNVPDGVLYVVEGAGGNRDFDNNLPQPRGSGLGVDQDDAATGSYTPQPGLTVQQGPADWLDTNLTNLEMVTNFPNAGTGTKITTKFKSKVFSFGHVVVNNNNMTLFQISEPLSSTSSATSAMPAPYGTDINGIALNDPIGDTILDATNGNLISAPGSGPSSLLDQFTITKPDVHTGVFAVLLGQPIATPGGVLFYSVLVSNQSDYSLNGTQIRVTLPAQVNFAGTPSDNVTVQGSDVVYTLGRLPAGTQNIIFVPARVGLNVGPSSTLVATGSLISGTALPVATNSSQTVIIPSIPFL